MSNFQFPSDLSCIREDSKKVLESLADLNLDDSTIFDIKLCLEEALINSIKYGNKNNKNLNVEVDVIRHGDKIEVIVSDQGQGFDYKNCSDPTEDENLERTSGRGIFLISKLMDQVIYEKNGSRVRMIKGIIKK